MAYYPIYAIVRGESDDPNCSSADLCRSVGAPQYRLVLIIPIKDKVVPILQITFQWGLI